MRRGLLLGWVSWLYEIIHDWENRPIEEWMGEYRAGGSQGGF